MIEEFFDGIDGDKNPLNIDHPDSGGVMLQINPEFAWVFLRTWFLSRREKEGLRQVPEAEDESAPGSWPELELPGWRYRQVGYSVIRATVNSLRFDIRKPGVDQSDETIQMERPPAPNTLEMLAVLRVFCEDDPKFLRKLLKNYNHIFAVTD